MISLEKQIAELNKELEITLSENKSLKSAVKDYERQISEIHSAPIKHMNLAEDQDEIFALVEKIEKLETELDIKDTEIAKVKSDHRKAINVEKQKVSEYKDKMIEMRDNFNQKRNQFMQELLEKDEQILKLTKEVGKANIPKQPEKPNAFKKHKRSATPNDLGNIEARLSSLIASKEGITPTAETLNSTMNIQKSKQIDFESASIAEYKNLRKRQRMGDGTNRANYSRLIPSSFGEDLNRDIKVGHDDNDFTMSLDDEMSAVGHYPTNFMSNKSSRIELGKTIPRPQSATRKDFMFGVGGKQFLIN